MDSKLEFEPIKIHDPEIAPRTRMNTSKNKYKIEFQFSLLLSYHLGLLVIFFSQRFYIQKYICFSESYVNV